MKRSHLLVLGLIVAIAATAVLAKKDKPKDATSAPAAAATAATAKTVATVAGEPITTDELDKAAAGQLMRVRQQEYDIKENVLEALIQKKLLDRESAARGVSVADLIKAEIEDKTAAVTKEEVDKFYEQNKARIGNRTREDVGPDIERQLNNQKQNERRNAFLGELRAKADVKVSLEPPRVTVPIPADAFAKGPATAPITIVEFSDYQCPYCRRAHPTVEQILTAYGDKVRFVYRDYPLNFHPRAVPASIAARCAADQGKFWEFHKNLMEVDGDLSDADLTKRSTTVGLDQAAFSACYAEKRHEAAIQTSFDDGASVGVTGTPAFFVNGRALVGARPFDDFKAVIDDELARLQPVSAAK